MTYKPPKGEDSGLDAQYRPIGIPAVSAAAAQMHAGSPKGKSPKEQGDNGTSGGQSS